MTPFVPYQSLQDFLNEERDGPDFGIGDYVSFYDKKLGLKSGNWRVCEVGLGDGHSYFYKLQKFVWSRHPASSKDCSVSTNVEDGWHMVKSEVDVVSGETFWLFSRTLHQVCEKKLEMEFPNPWDPESYRPSKWYDFRTRDILLGRIKKLEDGRWVTKSTKTENETKGLVHRDAKKLKRKHFVQPDAFDSEMEIENNV